MFAIYVVALALTVHMGWPWYVWVGISVVATKIYVGLFPAELPKRTLRERVRRRSILLPVVMFSMLVAWMAWSLVEEG